MGQLLENLHRPHCPSTEKGQEGAFERGIDDKALVLH